MDSGPTIRLTDWVFTSMLTELSMKACGGMISSMAREWRLGLMGQNMRENMLSDANMESDSTSGMTGRNTSESGRKIKFLASASTPG